MNIEEKKMNQLKEEYMEVQPPKEGLKQLEQTISRAKKDKRKMEKVHFWRNIAVGAAAVFAGVFVTVNVNSDLAYAMEQIPVIGSVIKVITLDRFQEEGEHYSADITTPKLEAEEDMPGIDKVNEAVQKERDELIAEYREIFEAYVKEEGLAEDDGQTNYYNVDADYEVVTDNEEYFVLLFSTTRTSASAYQVNKYYTIDKKTGELLSLKDLFQEDSDYIAVISENIKEQMKKQMSEDKNVQYWLNNEVTEWNFEKIKEDQNFYINEKGNLVIAFDEYEVAPGYMGAVTFEIPREELASILK